MRTKIFIIIVLFASICLAARADQITQSFNGGPFNTSKDVGLTFIASRGFNASLGDLTSIEVSIAGFYKVQLPTGVVSQAVILGPTFVPFDLPTWYKSGTYFYSSTQTISDPLTVSLFSEGIFSNGFSWGLSFSDNPGATDTNVSPNGFAGELTYNYVPAVVSSPPSETPEPSSLLLLGTGFVGLCGVAGQRRWSLTIPLANL